MVSLLYLPKCLRVLTFLSTEKDYKVFSLEPPSLLFIRIIGLSHSELASLCPYGSVNYASELCSVTDGTLGISTLRTCHIAVEPELLIPTMHPSGKILNTLCVCRACQCTRGPRPSYWRLTSSAPNTEVTHNPCSSFIIEMWMRKGRRGVVLIDRSTEEYLIVAWVPVPRHFSTLKHTVWR